MPVNPFELRGPEFLAFYACCAVVVIIVVVLLRRLREAEDPRAENRLHDPYEIAFLRGGKNHLLQTALVSLVDRGLLLVNDLKLKTVKPAAVDKAQRPLDRAILTKFLWETEATALYQEESIVAQAEAVGETLREKRLLPDAGQKSARLTAFVGALALLWIVAGIKVYIGISRGRPVLFLIILAGVAAVVLYKLSNPFRTAAGAKALSQIKETLRGLVTRKGSITPNSPTNEATLLAAAFGLAMLPSALTDQIKPLKLHPTGTSGCGTGCSGGSSCGGSSCGGGGCGGGGCGGCGG
jgi:uncharacterized protein (TIGR04222 family)